MPLLNQKLVREEKGEEREGKKEMDFQLEHQRVGNKRRGRIGNKEE
jgi:hypothetical protein